MLNGKPWELVGYNLPCANPFGLSDASLDYYLDNIKANSGANTVRVWFFQSQGGPGNWANFDRVIADLDSQGMRAVVTLTNDTSTCDEPSASTFYKDLAWYQTGYQSPEGGYALSFRQYAAQVAQHFTHDPGVAFWQLVNEAQAPTVLSNGQLSCSEASATAALRAFADDMASVLHQADPNHLVNLGTQGSGQCGIGNDADYANVHAGGIDLCEYHDYGQAATAMPSYLAADTADCHSLNKPIFIGESGIVANVQPDGTPASNCDPWPSCTSYPVTSATLQQRAQFFASKFAAARKNGVNGYIIWVKSPFYSPSNEGYAIGDGDPTEGAMLQFSSNGTVATADIAWAPVLAVLGVSTMFAVKHGRRRREDGGFARSSKKP